MPENRFWDEVFTLHNAVTPCIKWRICVFGIVAAAIWFLGQHVVLIPVTSVTPYELIGVMLAVMLMIRTNSGYDRWYEGRKLWGGIVNQTRNLAQIGLAYGPRDSAWSDQFVRWVAAFPHACRHSLRGETDIDDMANVLSDSDLVQLREAQHMPLFVSNQIARMLHEAIDSGQMERFAFLQADQQRTLLIDHIGACERILKTPLAKSLSVKIRRFLFIYLVALPFGIYDKVGIGTPLIVMLVAYPLLSLDQISVELQNPFSRERLSHLPLDDICQTIQRNVFELLDRHIGDQDSELIPAEELHSIRGRGGYVESA